jgi:copper chaperone CopZ
MKTTTIEVEGMHCAGCARTVEALLSSLAGVKKARVSFPEATARVLHDPEATSAGDLAAAIEKGGFKARTE